MASVTDNSRYTLPKMNAQRATTERKFKQPTRTNSAVFRGKPLMETLHYVTSQSTMLTRLPMQKCKVFAIRKISEGKLRHYGNESMLRIILRWVRQRAAQNDDDQCSRQYPYCRVSSWTFCTLVFHEVDCIVRGLRWTSVFVQMPAWISKWLWTRDLYTCWTDNLCKFATI